MTPNEQGVYELSELVQAQKAAIAAKRRDQEPVVEPAPVEAPIA